MLDKHHCAEPSFNSPPVVWSIAGNDSGGGAGLTADQRAADAFGVHLCPVVAAITAQNSVEITRVEPVPAEWLDTQLSALASDLPAVVIKTGLLGSIENVEVVARWADRLRTRGQVSLVVDPVLGASTGTSFASEEVQRAYCELLLPRATVITPNQREARMLLGEKDESLSIPELGQRLRFLGAASVAITGGDNPESAEWSHDWIDTHHASGWLSLPRVRTPNNHGTGCTFASSVAAALALGFVSADALVLAKMATTHALRSGYAAGQGAGPVAACGGFAVQPEQMPFMSWGESANIHFSQHGAPARSLDLYAIVDSAERVAQVVAAGVKTVQLRLKTPAFPDEKWKSALRESIRNSVLICREAGAQMIVNDHWRLAHEYGAKAVHLGQEDLCALGEAGRQELMATGLELGISSHSLWELARARSLNPSYVACGPVWPTLTKAMPWRAQGLDNLAWWVRMAGVPVVAIGGILEHQQLALAAQSGASGVCVVRGLGEDPAATIPAWQTALEQGRRAVPLPVPDLPHPSLEEV